METQLISLMDKRKAISGYTMIEMIIVLMVISILMSVSLLFIPKRATLRFFMSQLRDHYLITQLDAIQNHETKPFEIDDDVLIAGKRTIPIPDGIVCESSSFVLYPSGNINHAGTIHCYQDQFKQSLTIQLGSGHAQFKE